MKADAKSCNHNRNTNVPGNGPDRLDWLRRDRSAAPLSRSRVQDGQAFGVIQDKCKIELASNNVDANSESTNATAAWIAGDRRPMVFGAALREAYSSVLSRDELRQLRLTNGGVAAALKQRLGKFNGQVQDATVHVKSGPALR